MTMRDKRRAGGMIVKNRQIWRASAFISIRSATLPPDSDAGTNNEENLSHSAPDRHLRAHDADDGSRRQRRPVTTAYRAARFH